jgi:hypothetical protein
VFPIKEKMPQNKNGANVIRAHHQEDRMNAKKDERKHKRQSGSRTNNAEMEIDLRNKSRNQKNTQGR